MTEEESSSKKVPSDTESEPFGENEDSSSHSGMGNPIATGGGRRKRKQSRKMKKSRKSNNALKEWVNFVKKVRAEEKIDSYKKAMSRAKVRADKGEKWRSMKGGMTEDDMEGAGLYDDEEDNGGMENGSGMKAGLVLGGRRRRSRSRSRSRSKSRSRSSGRSRNRTMRRSRGRSYGRN
jgi:hypothetical protein